MTATSTFREVAVCISRRARLGVVVLVGRWVRYASFGVDLSGGPERGLLAPRHHREAFRAGFPWPDDASECV